MESIRLRCQTWKSGDWCRLISYSWCWSRQRWDLHGSRSLHVWTSPANCM